MSRKILLIGGANVGKKTTGKLMADMYQLKYGGSISNFALKHVVFPKLKHRYTTTEECFQDRHNHRKEWFQIITDFNQKDKGRLYKEMVKDSDVIVGLRNVNELLAVRHLFEYVLWIKRDKVPLEKHSSCSVSEHDADATVLNNGDLENLSNNIRVSLLWADTLKSLQ